MNVLLTVNQYCLVQNVITIRPQTMNHPTSLPIVCFRQYGGRSTAVCSEIPRGVAFCPPSAAHNWQRTFRACRDHSQDWLPDKDTLDRIGLPTKFPGASVVVALPNVYDNAPHTVHLIAYNERDATKKG